MCVGILFKASEVIFVSKWARGIPITRLSPTGWHYPAEQKYNAQKIYVYFFLPHD